MINSKFRVDIVGDIEFKDLVADIYYEDRCLAMLSQEHGFDELEIEIYPPQDNKKWNFNYYEFEKVLNYAKQRLWELRKSTE